MRHALLALVALAAGCAGTRSLPSEPGARQAAFAEAVSASGRCVRDAVRLPRGDVPSDVVVVSFLVSAEGVPEEIRFLGTPDASAGARAAIVRAISSCQWQPGVNAAGERVPAQVTFPLRFSGR